MGMSVTFTIALRAHEAFLRAETREEQMKRLQEMIAAASKDWLFDNDEERARAAEMVHVASKMLKP
jgi:hypothetical protein